MESSASSEVAGVANEVVVGNSLSMGGASVTKVDQMSSAHCKRLTDPAHCSQSLIETRPAQNTLTTGSRRKGMTAISHAGSPPPSALVGVLVVAGLRPWGLAGALANEAIKASPSSRYRTARSGRLRRRSSRQRPLPVPGDRVPCFFCGYVNEASLTN